MHFSVTTLLALAASAFAQNPTPDFDPIYTPTPNQIIPAGSTFTITWEAPAKYAADTIAITLIGGATRDTQVPLGTIATGVKNSALSYEWHVDASLGNKAIYGLVFELERDPDIFEYSNSFYIKPSSGSNTKTGSSTSTIITLTGFKNVTLSRYTTTSAAAPLTTNVTVIMKATTTVPCYNSTTLATYTKMPYPPQTTFPSPTKAIVASTARAAPTNATLPTAIVPTIRPGNAGSHIGASSLALAGGLVVAFLAL